MDRDYSTRRSIAIIVLMSALGWFWLIGLGIAAVAVLGEAENGAESVEKAGPVSDTGPAPVAP